MTHVLLFHHALGLTDGVRALADRLSAGGHVVHLPDLFDGKVFGSLEDGLGYVRELGFGTVVDRGVAAAEGLPDDLVVAGISLGVPPAQALAQNRPGARGALLLEACLPASEFGTWPAGVPFQVHGMADDPFFAHEGDLDAARALLASTDRGEVFTYPGDRHLFTDASLPSYDEAATDLVVSRALAFLAAAG